MTEDGPLPRPPAGCAFKTPKQFNKRRRLSFASQCTRGSRTAGQAGGRRSATGGPAMAALVAPLFAPLPPWSSSRSPRTCPPSSSISPPPARPPPPPPQVRLGRRPQRHGAGLRPAQQLALLLRRLRLDLRQLHPAVARALPLSSSSFSSPFFSSRTRALSCTHSLLQATAAFFSHNLPSNQTPQVPPPVPPRDA